MRSAELADTYRVVLGVMLLYVKFRFLRNFRCIYSRFYIFFPFV